MCGTEEFHIEAIWYARLSLGRVPSRLRLKPPPFNLLVLIKVFLLFRKLIVYYCVHYSFPSDRRSGDDMER